MIAIIVGAAIASGFVFATQYLWNWLVPELFSGPSLTFWQALGLLALTKILFSGIGKRGWGPSGGGPHWKRHWKDRWNTMSPEDRERFQKKMREKWCYPAKDRSELTQEDKREGEI